MNEIDFNKLNKNNYYMIYKWYYTNLNILELYENIKIKLEKTRQEETNTDYSNKSLIIQLDEIITLDKIEQLIINTLKDITGNIINTPIKDNLELDNLELANLELNNLNKSKSKSGIEKYYEIKNKENVDGLFMEVDLSRLTRILSNKRINNIITLLENMRETMVYVGNDIPREILLMNIYNSHIDDRLNKIKMTFDKARTFLDKRVYFDYIDGILLKIDLGTLPIINAHHYDNKYGKGSLKKLINDIKNKINELENSLD
jgi:hypothetical protein